MISKNILNARQGVLYQSLGELGALLNQAFPMLGEGLQQWVQQTNERMQQVEQQDVLDRLRGQGPNAELIESINRATHAANGERLIPIPASTTLVPEPVEQEVDWQAVNTLIDNTFSDYVVGEDGETERKWVVPDELFVMRNEQGEIEPAWLNELNRYDPKHRVLAFNQIGEEELAAQIRSEGRLLLIDISRPLCKQWLLVVEDGPVRFMVFTYVPVEESWIAHQVGQFVSIDDVRASLEKALGDAAVELTLEQAEQKVRDMANRNKFGSTSIAFLKGAAPEAEIDLLSARTMQIRWPAIPSVPYVVLMTSEQGDGWVEQVALSNVGAATAGEEQPASAREETIKAWNAVPFRLRHDLVAGLARTFHVAHQAQEKANVDVEADE